MAGPVRRRGTIAAFDHDRGWGTVRTEDGTELPFHCTAIADGSRDIAVGVVVVFDVVAGHMGRHEAQSVEPV